MKWTEKEKELLMDHAFASDAETIDEQIEHAIYKMYQEEEPSEFKERTLSACKNMFYKIVKGRQSKP
jgi:hypothetical protein